MKHPKNRLHSVMIAGATPAGVAAANKLGELGIPVTLVDGDADLDQKLALQDYRFESGVLFNHGHRPGLIRILRNPGIRCVLPADVVATRHSPQGFHVRIRPRPTFVDAQRCTLCGRCTAVCPVNGEAGQKPIRINSRQSLPGSARIDKRQQPLCQAGCPLGVNAQGYIALARAGRYDEALALIRRDNVLPAICGRICTHPCESACRRAEMDAPLAIRDIKRFVADRGRVIGAVGQPCDRPAHDRRAAVIGSGPAGLAAAVDLARQGFEVVILEKENEAGGLLRFGIGPHRLPREILDRELDEIRKEGVAIQVGRSVSLAKELPALQKQYHAVVIATGSWADRRIGVPGEDLADVEGCISFLTRMYRGEIQSFAHRTAVIGDGNAAFDLARALRRMGAEVTIISWFAQHEIPADADEVTAALDEGVHILDRRQVVAFSGDGDRLQSLQVQATQPGPPDADGIAWPVLASGGQMEYLAFEKAFVAIGQTSPYRTTDWTAGLISQRGYITADETGRTAQKGLYAAGDAASGATSVVQAMASGRKAAAAVVQDLLDARPAARVAAFHPVRPVQCDFVPIDSGMASQGRTPMPELPALGRAGNFSEVMVGYNQDQVYTEAGRCLQCGACAECLECIQACGQNLAIRHDELPAEIVENVGVLIVADPDMVPGIKGEDVIRAYGPASAKPDISAMILRGYAAAARAMVLLKETAHHLKGQGIAFVRPDPGLAETVRIGVFACRCNDSLGWSPAMTDYMQQLTTRPQIVHSQMITSACHPDGVNAILTNVRDKGLTRIVLASCVCCPLNYICSACTDQRSRLKSGLFTGTGISRSMVQTCNLRGEVLRLMGSDEPLAVDLFKGLMQRSIGRAAKLMPFPTPLRQYNFTSAVIGQSEAAWDSALILAQVGFEVLMFGTPKHPLEHAPEHPNVFGFRGSAVHTVSGTLGDFKVHVHFEDSERNFTVGSVILGEKSRHIALYQRHSQLPSLAVQSAMQKEGALGVPFMYPGTTSISGLFLADPPGVQISKHTKGAAVAALAAAVMPRSPRQSRGFSVSIKEDLCRSCGRCLKACPYQAVALKPNIAGALSAVVDDALCKGCGNCISVCPTNAADSPFRDQAYLERTLEELLTGSVQ